MENKMEAMVIAMKRTIYELNKTQAEILDRMTSNSTSRTSMLAVVSNEITQLEEHVSRVESDTRSIEYTNNLDNVTKQMSNLLMKVNRLNTLAVNLQKTTAFDENSGKDGSTVILSEDESVCFSNILDRNAFGKKDNIPSSENWEEFEEDNIEYRLDNECCSGDANIHNLSNYMNGRTVQLLTHNAINNESNTIHNEPLGAQNDTKNINKLREGSDNVKVQQSSLLNNSGDENVVNENENGQDNPLCTLNKEVDNKDLPEIENCNISNSESRIHKNESGYKSKGPKTQNDNRVSFHNNQESFKGDIDKSLPNMDVQIEESIVPNIKPTTHNSVDERPMMTSTTSYNSSRRSRRRRREEDIFVERLFHSDQPKTFREWYHHFRQVKVYASVRVRSGVVNQANGHDVILVIDTSERMSEYFQQLKSAALQYVYGIKQLSECGGMENGIGLAVFGQQTRLIQEATNDYELVMELIGKLRPDGDAPVLAGLLMGYAGVSSCKYQLCLLPSSTRNVPIQANMIVFTNGSSEQCKVLPEDEQISNLDLRNLPVPSDINAVIDEITASSTKIYYVPIGRHQCNNILEHAVRQTNGKMIQVNEMNRLINMTQVMLLAIGIAADLRYSENQSREVIRMKISDASNFHDINEDCLDMVIEFSNPLKFCNMRGEFVELKFNTLKLGDRVRRGPYCRCKSDDLGLAGTVIGQDRDGDVLVEWDHGLVCPYDYVDERDVQHIVKVNEVRMLVDELIAVGCRVVRGQDWKYGDLDGGKGKLGTVLGIPAEGKAVVRWDRQNIGIYKMGCEGLFELKLCDTLSSNSSTIQNEETDNYHNTGQWLRKRESVKHQNALNTIKTNECDPEDYLIPIYSDVAVSAIWEYQRVSKWRKYPSGINVKIEKAFQRKKSGKIIIEMDRTTYIIHFSRMVQENFKNKTILAVRRKD
ncbi:uncharacterized protein LOC127734536 [Mytilus californianus]|uniref:uncharacterized protein LOC127734536 n=1 Tax=Mytilus californianus TaxID=6549 RepID=UPI002247E093|nr:uncharacterized protein LOC127734536 [Mytilus californianus]